MDPLRLSRDEYHEHFAETVISGVKEMRRLERAQHFVQPGMESWEAFNRGDWSGALVAAGEKRAEFETHGNHMADLGIRRRRMRIVEYPLSPCMQWSSHVLRVRVKAGDNIRALDAEKMGELPNVPEAVIFDRTLLYQVIYDERGRADGAWVHRNRNYVRAVAERYEGLWEQAEDFTNWFAREVAPLPPPQCS